MLGAARGCSQIGLSSLFMAAKNGSNSGRSSGLPPTLVKICAPTAPRSLMARSTLAGAGIGAPSAAPGR